MAVGKKVVPSSYIFREARLMQSFMKNRLYKSRFAELFVHILVFYRYLCAIDSITNKTTDT